MHRVRKNNIAAIPRWRDSQEMWDTTPYKRIVSSLQETWDKLDDSLMFKGNSSSFISLVNTWILLLLFCCLRKLTNRKVVEEITSGLCINKACKVAQILALIKQIPVFINCCKIL